MASDDPPVWEDIVCRSQSEPDTTAVVKWGEVEEVATYGFLDHRSLRLAGCLAGGRSQLVAVCCTRSLALPIALLAVWRAGCAYVFIDPTLPPSRVASLLKESRPAVVVAEEGEAADLLAPMVHRMLVVDTSCGVVEEVQVEGDPSHGEWEGVAYVVCTSGSSGSPKGVVVPHKAVANTLRSMPPSFNTMPALASAGFDISVVELFLPLLRGGRVVVSTASLDPLSLLFLLDVHRPNGVQATPTTFLMLSNVWSEGHHHPDVIICGGETFPPPLAQKLLRRCGALYNAYGPSETTIWVSLHRVVAVTDGIPIGDPLPGNTFTLHEDGELVVSGVNVATGYLHGRRFDGSYATGDIMSDASHGLIFRGRKDVQIKIRGNRVELGDIEAHAAEWGGVATTFGEGDLKVLVLYISHGDPRVVREHLATRLPRYMVPHFIEVLHHPLPLTTTGKVDRLSLPPPSSHATIAAGNSPPDVMAAVVAAVLNRLPHPDEDLREAGVDSVSAVLIATKLEAELSRHWGVRNWSGIEDGVPLILRSGSLRQLEQDLLRSAGLEAAVPPRPTNPPRGARNGSAAPNRPAEDPGITACRMGDVAVVQRLLDEGWNVDTADRFGSTALHYAAGSGSLTICKLLVDHGGDVFKADKKSGRTALHWAARQGQREVCEWLLSKGLAVDAMTKDLTTPLQLAAWGGHYDVCEWLAGEGADVSHVNRWGCTAVHFAALAGETGACKWLFRHDLDLSFCNHQGHNALHKAAYGGHRDLCAWLQDGPPCLDPDSKIADARGQTPDMLALKAGYESLAAWLRRHRHE